MTDAEPYTGRLTTLDATLAAETLITAFHEGDDDFARLFFESDRDTLGAVICYADLCIRGFSNATGEDPTVIRQQLRRLISQQQALMERGDVNG